MTNVDSLFSRLDFVGDSYAQDPDGWARDVLGVHLWSRQRQIVESVRDNARTAVRSGHGVGKTFVAAVILLWFLDTHPRSRVISTATKWSQIEKLLWHEIRQLLARAESRSQAKSRPVFGGERLLVELRLPDGRYALGLSSKPEQAETFQGHHAPYILLIVDEASGVDQRIYDAAEGYLTTDGSRLLLIGNPTRTSGEFHAAFRSKRADYATLHISALDSPAITGEVVPDEVRAALTGQKWVDSRRRAWGEDSPLFKVRVLGDFAPAGENVVIELGDVEDAQDRELPADPVVDPVVVTCDVARFGSDETVIAVRVGRRVRIVERYSGKATTHTAARVAEVARRFPHSVRKPVRIVVDVVGVGGGVVDQLKAEGWGVVAYNAGAAARRPDLYPNRRSELWFELAEALPGLDLDGDEQLLADLTAPLFSYDARMRRVVEPKDRTKQRLGRSPDRADAVMLTLVEGSQWFTEMVDREFDDLPWMRVPPAGHPDWEIDPPRGSSLMNGLAPEMADELWPDQRRLPRGDVLFSAQRDGVTIERRRSR